MERPRVAILVVEDQPLIRMLLADSVAEAGYQPLEADGTQEALRTLASRSDIAMVVTDVEMPPGPDGFALAAEVAERWPHIAVIVASGRVRPAAGQLADGVVFLDKPLDSRRLVALMRKRLGV